MAEFVCTVKCFYNNALMEEGAVVIADEKEMKGNPCFKKVKEEKPQPENKPVEEETK